MPDAKTDDPILNDFGMTELHLAAYHGELDWVQNCLNGGLDIEARDRGGNTPLHWAADMAVVDGDREAIVAELIRRGADVDARRNGGETVLMVACNSGNRDVVRQLLEAGADVSAQSNKGETAMDWAGENDDIQAMLIAAKKSQK